MEDSRNIQKKAEDLEGAVDHLGTQRMGKIIPVVVTRDTGVVPLGCYSGTVVGSCLKDH